MTFQQFLCGILILGLASCTKSKEFDKNTPANNDTVIKVDASKFLTSLGNVTITTETRSLSNGTSAPCFKIVTKSTPSDHAQGPWCPTNISDDVSKGGIWLENGNVYNVDGAFIKNLATFYNNTTWQMYDGTTGEVKRTLTKEDCQAAANPMVGAQYKNYCVECLPSYVSNLNRTIYIPITPVKLSSPIRFGAGPGSTGPIIRGIAFNGVIFDAPAPVNAILGAYTLAPFDHAGGHINMVGGYHYHSATGKSTKISQPDGHSSMIGYALDGFGIYERLSASGTEDTDLDASRGHYDPIRGYHYHVDKPGANNFINSLAGAYAL